MFGISPLNLLEKILSATNFGLDIIVDVCPEAGKVANTNKNFRLRSDDRTPSAHLYPPANGQGYWRVVDFGMGEGSRSFSPIDLYMWNMGYSQSQFSVALKELAQKYGVDERLNASVNRPIITQREALPVELGLPPKLEFYNGFAGVDLSVWGPKVKPEHLEAYHWRAVKSMAFVRDGKATTIVATDTYPIFAEECSYYDNSQKQKVFWKVYEPKNSDKAFRFRIIGQVPNNYIYGLDTLRQEWHKNGEEKLEVVLLVSGGSDAVCAKSMGYFSVWLNSETRGLKPEELQLLFKYAKKVIAIPDIDETGIRVGKNQALEHPLLYTAWLSPKDFGNLCDNRGRRCKDLKDYLHLYPEQKDMNRLLGRAHRAQFWKVEKHPKTGNNRYVISPASLYYFLWLHDYCMLKDDTQRDPVYIHSTGIKVKKVTAKSIHNFLKEWCEEQGVDEALQNELLGHKCLPKNNEGHLYELDNLDFTTATATSQRFYFLDSVVEVTADGIERMSYNNVPSGKYVWEDNVIHHDFRKMDPQVLLSKDDDGRYHVTIADRAPSKLLRFVNNTSRIYWRKQDEQGQPLTQQELAEEEQCFFSKVCNLGYYMHSFKSESAPWAAICLDSTLTENDNECAGGSGKTFYWRAISTVLNVTALDGRSLQKKTNMQFAYDSVTSATTLIVVDECPKNFDYNQFYGQISGSLRVERKGKDSYEIPYHQAPKWLFASNYTLSNHDPSTERRFWPVVFSDYYHQQTAHNDYIETRTIADDFGQRLMSDNYSEVDWQADYSFILDCLQIYLSLPEQERKQLPPMFQVERREQQATIGMDFKQWADEYFSENGGNLDRPIKQSEVLNRYLTETGNKLSMHSLTRKMKAYCNFATHIHCLNPASVTGRRKDGERFIKREGDQTLQYYYVESNRAIATDNTLGPEQSEFPF